jgi:septum formation protein
MPADAGLKLILGSGSPRRLELLRQIGVIPHDVRPPDVNEDVARGEQPRDYVSRIVANKLAAVLAATDEVVLCADTTVALGRRIVGKPADADEARAFLSLLSGRRHRVITGVGVKRGDRIWIKDVVTTVSMKRLTEAEIDWYLSTGDWQGKAGAYAIQGPAGVFIPWITGSFTGVVGLPLTETAGLLQAAGYPILKEAR